MQSMMICMHGNRSSPAQESVLRLAAVCDSRVHKCADADASPLVPFSPPPLGLILKGGKEAATSNAALHSVIQRAIEGPAEAPSGIPGALVGLVTSRSAISDLLKLDDVIDLVIPRGSNALVKNIKSNTRIPVLGHADGVCHVYVDKAADIPKALSVVLDSKTDYPSACNAAETLLLHEDVAAGDDGEKFISALNEAGVVLFGGPRAAARFKLPLAADLHHEYSGLEMAVEIVSGLDQAIEHITKYGRCGSGANRTPMIEAVCVAAQVSPARSVWCVQVVGVCSL